MLKTIVKLPDMLLATAPALASFTLSHVDKLAATLAACLGCLYLGLGVALRIRKWRRGDSE